jgi:hypothetical protein
MRHGNIKTSQDNPRGSSMPEQATILDRVSIELTNRCAKACWFCYNGLP